MTATYEQQDELNRRVENLQAFEREYRSRLRAYLTGLLNDLNYADEAAAIRQEVIGPDWAAIASGLEVKVVGVEPPRANGLQRHAIVEIRAVEW